MRFLNFLPGRIFYYFTTCDCTSAPFKKSLDDDSTTFVKFIVYHSDIMRYKSCLSSFELKIFSKYFLLCDRQKKYVWNFLRANA